MIASLAMYDYPWLRAANDRLWAAVAARLRDAGIDRVPDALTRGTDLDDVWRSPDLLLAQTCGYPLMTELRETVQLVATPIYDAPGCRGASHSAAIIVRVDDPARTLHDLRGRWVAVNGARSNTGMNLLRVAVAPHTDGGTFFGRVVTTGSHARSVAAVLSGRADAASIDTVSLAHLEDRYPRRKSGLRVLDWTEPTPGLPLITSGRTPPDTLRALQQAIYDVALDDRLSDTLAALRILGFETLGFEPYDAVTRIQGEAVAQGYPVLA